MAVIGSTSNLVGGMLALTLPDGAKFWCIQNQDTAPIAVQFPPGSGLSSLTLAGGLSMNDGLGGYIDSIGFPVFGPMTLTSAAATAQFGSGSLAIEPVNSFARSV